MQPHLTRLLWLATLIDGAIHREWLLALGRRSALGRLAHLVCELFSRLQVVGLIVDGSSFHLPLTQTNLADALGLSPVHVNRTIQELRRRGILTWQHHAVEIHDWKRLAEVAEYNPAYLSLDREPR